ncbi:MAG: hypothetical protein V4644_00160 [Patescibacteria group bacterium]
MGTMLFAASSFVTLSDLSASERRTHADTAIDALLLARSRAQSGMCSEEECVRGRPHGVYKDAGKLTVFEGETYRQRFTEADLSFEAPASGLSFGEEITFSAKGARAGALSSFDAGAGPLYRIHVSRDGGIDVASDP